MKVLVTGAGGFLGTAVVERLLSSGYDDIRCFLRPGRGNQAIEELREKYPHAKVELFFGNLLSPADVFAAVDQVDVIYHLAAQLRGSAADIFLNTVVTSKNLLEALDSRRCVRIVLVSSFGVYSASGVSRGTVVDELAPLESSPAKRDLYSHAKLRQELLFREYQHKRRFELVIVRPGVIYGPGGSRLSLRVGFNLFGVLVHCGGGNRIPLVYVDNCAEAIVVAGREAADGEVYNVVDDDLPTSRQYLRAYKRNVSKIRTFPLPYIGVKAFAKVLAAYHEYSKGQLPAVLTPYKATAAWQRRKFTNAKLKSIGWSQLVSTQEGLRRTFEAFRAADLAMAAQG